MGTQPDIEDEEDCRAVRYMMLGATRYEIRQPEGPCVGCGKEIQPGQLYMPPPNGPRHLGC